MRTTSAFLGDPSRPEDLGKSEEMDKLRDLRLVKFASFSGPILRLLGGTLGLGGGSRSSRAFARVDDDVDENDEVLPPP